MTQFSRIEMAFELLKAAVTAGDYFRIDTNSEDNAAYRAKWAFMQTDAFIKEAKKQGEDL